MKTNLYVWLLAAVLSCVLLAGCGGGNSCKITAAVTPATASADHSLPSPGNQAQFSLTSSVSGNCPLPDTTGTWSSSDPVNVPISSQGLATCRNGPVSVLVTISNSSTVRGQAFTSAMLTCK